MMKYSDMDFVVTKSDVERWIDDVVEEKEKAMLAVKGYRKVTLCEECCRKTGCMIREELYSYGAEEPMFCSLGVK